MTQAKREASEKPQRRVWPALPEAEGEKGEVEDVADSAAHPHMPTSGSTDLC